MEVTLGYLDEERVKLWTELNNVKKALDEAVAKLSQTDKATVSSIQSLGQSLEGKIAVVKKMALPRFVKKIIGELRQSIAPGLIAI